MCYRQKRGDFLLATRLQSSPHLIGGTVTPLSIDAITHDTTALQDFKRDCIVGSHMDDDLVRAYALEAQKAMEEEANRRIAEQTDAEEEERLRNTRVEDVVETEHLVPVLLSRLGSVRAALDGHGGGIAVSKWERVTNGFSFVLDLTGACLSCGAAPGTLEGVRNDLESDAEIERIQFSTTLLDTFDELGREFILAHGNVEFVDVSSGN